MATADKTRTEKGTSKKGSKGDTAKVKTSDPINKVEEKLDEVQSEVRQMREEDRETFDAAREAAKKMSDAADRMNEASDDAKEAKDILEEIEGDEVSLGERTKRAGNSVLGGIKSTGRFIGRVAAKPLPKSRGEAIRTAFWVGIAASVGSAYGTGKTLAEMKDVVEDARDAAGAAVASNPSVIAQTG